ncbi:MAG: hypothetical protein CL578_12795 [Alteromonadaceae bacterium]|nr:hypothetical protein [Alteromonadaceae bacterium]
MTHNIRVTASKFKRGLYQGTEACLQPPVSSFLPLFFFYFCKKWGNLNNKVTFYLLSVIKMAH